MADTFIKRIDSGHSENNIERSHVKGFKNFAFISHVSEDNVETMRLYKFLTSYHVPVSKIKKDNLPNKLKEIFLDIVNMKGNNVHEEIAPQLKDSLNLVVICSSEMKNKEMQIESKDTESYVNQEIRTFIEERDVHTSKEERFKHIFLFNIKGDYEDNYPRYYKECANELGVPIKNWRVVDLTKANNNQVNEYHGRTSGAYINLIASMLQVEPLALWKLYTHQKTTKFLLSMLMVLTFIVITGMLAITTWGLKYRESSNIVKDIQKAELKVDGKFNLNPIFIQESLLKVLPKHLTLSLKKSFRWMLRLHPEAEELFRKYSEDGIFVVVNMLDDQTINTSELPAFSNRVHGVNRCCLPDYTSEGNIIVGVGSPPWVLIYNEYGDTIGLVTSNDDYYEEMINNFDSYYQRSDPLSAIISSGYQKYINTIVLSNDKKYILTASNDSTARVWRLNSGTVELIKTFRHRGKVNSAKFSKNNRFLVTSSSDCFVRIWDWKNDKLVDSLRHSTPVISANFNWDNNKIVTTTEKSVRVWSNLFSNPTVIDSLNEPAIQQAAFSPNDDKVILITFDCWKIWNRRKNSSPAFNNKYYFVCTSNYSPNGDNYIDWRKNNYWVVDTRTKNRIKIPNGYDVNSCAFNVDGDCFVSACADHVIRIYDLKSEAKVKELRGHSNSVNKAVYSPDGKLIVSASCDSTVRIWDVKTGKELRVSPLRGHLGSVNSAIFSMDGRYVISTSDDGTVRKWSVKNGTGKVIFKFKVPISCAIASPDGLYYIIDNKVYNIAAKPNNIKIKDLNTDNKYAYFSEDGRYIISTSPYTDGFVFQEFPPLQQLINEARIRIQNKTNNSIIFKSKNKKSK